MGSAPKSPLGAIIGAAFLGACIWLISIGHSWEGVVLAVVFMVAAAVKK